MNCFKLVKSVLDEQYGAIPGKAPFPTLPNQIG